MGISEKMTGLMNAVRSVANADDKLSINDAISILKEPVLMSTVNPDLTTYVPNQADIEVTADSRVKFASTVDGINIGCYLPDCANIGLRSGNYIFECLIRGNLILTRFGDENGGLIFTNIILDENQWKKLRVPFFCSGTNSAFDIYGKGSKDQWFEIDHPYFVKLGGGGKLSPS